MKAYIFSPELNMEGKPQDLVAVLKAASDDSKVHNTGIYYVDSDGSEQFQSYCQLWDNARKLLFGLNQLGFKKGDQLIFQLKHEFSFINLFWACLLGGIVPVPLSVALTSENSEGFTKLVNVKELLNNPLIVTEAALRDVLDTRLIETNNVSLISFEEIVSQALKPAEVSQPNPEDLAFVQFSSGSTGSPKGVMLTHANLVYNIFQISAGAKITKEDFIASWMPLTHDMGLIGLHLTFVGSKSNQLKMSPETFIKRPTLLLEKITKHRATFFGCPNFALAWILEKVTDQELTRFDLSSVRILFNGAEPISLKIAREFITRMSKCNFCENAMFFVYGLAEASVGACFPPAGTVPLSHKFDRSLFAEQQVVREVSGENPDYIEFADVGKPLPGMSIRILDDQDRPVDENVVGNIVIKGPNVTSGYINNPEVNQRLFVDGYLRTGDLGMIRNQRLIITGRKKDIIFFNGQNLYAHDIERLCTELDGLYTGKVAACASFNEDTGKDEMLIFIQFRKKPEQFLKTVWSVKEHIARKTGQTVSHVIPVKAIPRTTSGKLQRFKLEQEYRNGEFVAIIRKLQMLEEETLAHQNGVNGLPRNEIDRHLVNLWSECLKQESIGIYDDFFALGGDSIKMMQLISELNACYKMELSTGDFIKLGQIAALSDYIATHRDTAHQVKYQAQKGDPQHIHEPFPVTDVQMAYLMGRSDQFEMGGVSTHGYYELETQLDPERLSAALCRVIQRHPMLRAVISPNGEQRILSRVPDYEIRVEDLSHLTSEEQQGLILQERERMSHAVYATDQWPLFEFKAFKITSDRYYLFIGFDLLIADGASIGIFFKELMAFYREPQLKLAELEFNFRDYVLAWQEFKQTETYRKDKNYWLSKLADFPPAPALPLQKDPKDVVTPRFKRHRKVYGQAEWSRLKKMAREHNITASALLGTAYAQVLAYWSNQPHLALNLTLFNRYPFHPEVNRIIGDFTSVLLLDLKLKPGLTFWEQAARVQNRLMEALDHRHYDGVEFIRELSKYHNLGAKAVMPVVFTSMLANVEDGETDGSLEDLGLIKTGISQTPQVYLDFQASEHNGALTITWDYVAELFDPNVITAMFVQYTALLNSLLVKNNEVDESAFAQTAAAVEASPLLVPAEEWSYITDHSEMVADFLRKQHEMIDRYNRTAAAIAETTLHRLFTEQAERIPEQTALVYEGQIMTYRELDECSNRLARYLQQQGIGRKDLVGVLARRGLWTIVNVMGILKAGAAYVPVDPEYPGERKEYILANSGCKMLLEPEFYRQNRIGELSAAAITDNHYPEDIAYIIYTSGSTGRPKGVVISHKAVANTIIDINQRFNVTSDDRIIGLSSMCFDLSVYDIFGALAAGATLVLIPDVRDVRHLQTVVERERITIWNSVPAIMDMMLETVGGDNSEELAYWQAGSGSDLVVEYHQNDSLRLVMLSGDWIALGLPEKIKANFPDTEVISLGGATEASIWSIYYPIEEVRSDWKSIPYGMPLANQQFYVLNYELGLCPAGVPGELYIGGVGLANGYLNDAEKTAGAFIEHPVLGRLYRTGDYGVWHQEGYIEFLGRKDQQVKIRGHRIELGEIESSLLRHEAVKNAVVVDRTDKNGKKYLCAYLVSDTELKPEEIKAHLLKELPDYMVPSYLLRIGEIPLTPNGKVDRKGLPEPDELAENDSQYVAPRNDIERKLAAIWQEVLGLPKVGIMDNFLELGGDSITMVRAVAKVAEQFRVEISYREFFNSATISKLAGIIAGKEISESGKYPAKTGDPQHINVPFPLTDVQMAYLMGRNDQFEMGGVSTHGYYEIETQLDLERFGNSLRKVIRRQPMLRAIILPTGEQKILEQVPEYQIVVEDISHLTNSEQQQLILQERERMSHAVFQTDHWPLFEFKAFKIAPETHYLFIGFDLLIADGTSMRILIKEIMDFYRNPQLELPELEFCFRDYILACQEFKQTETYRKDKNYWLSKLADFPPAPALPLRKEPKEIRAPRFKRHQKIYSQSQWEKLKKQAQEHNITPSALLCLAYARVLAYWSNQPKLAVNVTLFNRYPFHAEVNRIIGDFTSVMLLDVELEPQLSFWEQAVRIQNRLMEALEHRHYDGVEFIRELSKYHNFGTKAVMPVVFTSMLFTMEEEERGGNLEDFGVIKTGISQTSQVYLDYQASENRGNLSIIWDYVDELFDPSVIDTMFAQYTAILDCLIRGEEYLLEVRETDRLLIDRYNRTAADIPETTLHRLFTDQAERIPEQTALVYEGQTMTYRELDECSNRLARYLQQQGIGRKDLVGVLARRGLWTIVNVMGILKAGAAYVPVDPEYPGERKEYILANSGCKMLLEPEFYRQNRIGELSAAAITDNHYPEDIAYIIYTSGSTGRPKGVVISHKAVANTIIDINQRFNVTPDDRIIGLSSMCFDLSVYDIFGALAAGATLVLIPDVRDVRHLQTVVERERITIWNSVPAIMDMMLESFGGDNSEELAYWQAGSGSDLVVEYHQNDSLRLVMLSGDWIGLGLPDKIKANFPDAEVISLGGATEASIWSIYYPIGEVRSDWKSIPYGMPLANQQFYVLNYELGLCPAGVPGELYIGGVGLANGYLNDAEKTAGAFIEHPVLGRLYRTGDYGVWHQEGYIEFLGRKDQQVKIRGHRIELGEIESSLLRHEAVKNAVVVDRTDKNGKKYLCAYLVSDTELKPEEIKAHLLKELPDYMVPSYLLRIGEIPLTPNGKVDRKGLPEPDELAENDGQYVAPRNDIERKLAAIWQEVLGLPKVGIMDNFFMIGGDSLTAIKIFSLLQKDFNISINNIFQFPTIATLAQTLTYKNEGYYGKLREMKEDYQRFAAENGKLPAVLQQQYSHYLAEIEQRYRQVDLEKTKEYTGILLTGSTGFLGCHILQELLANTQAMIYIIVRNKDGEEAKSRLANKLRFYFGSQFYPEHQGRIRVIQGDLTRENLGLEPSVYRELATEIDCIINSAANVSHFGKYDDLYAINVKGVEQLVSFARCERVKDLHHISTSLVASGMVPGFSQLLFTEASGDLGQEIDDFYSKTKLEAEKVLNDARITGLNINIYRVGNIVFNSGTGKFQENIEQNAFYQMLRSFITMGVIPEIDQGLEFSCVDRISRAVVLLATRQQLTNEVYHICNSQKLSSLKLQTYLQQLGWELQAMTYDGFLSYVEKNCERDSVKPHLMNLMIFAQLLPWHNPTFFHYVADKTEKLLARMGFEWEAPTEGQIQKMITYGQQVGFFDAASR